MTATITISTLESHLWQAANILRGSPVDRTDWKSYILPLLFFKRICDVWDEEYQTMVDTYGEDFADEHRFQIPDGCHWRDVRETPTNVGTALLNALRGIESANQQHLYFGSFVLAVPIFCMLIEFIGIRSKEEDPVMSAKYDRLAHDLMKVSLTAYSWTAILGGILLFTFITLFPGFFKYMAGIFRPVMHVYALMFLAESGVLYVYYYGWDKMNNDPFLKWVHCCCLACWN